MRGAFHRVFGVNNLFYGVLVWLVLAGIGMKLEQEG
jgi:hypothetical protein